MVRTKASGGTRVSGGKAPSKGVGRSTSSTSSSSDSPANSSSGTGGGNVMKMWPTPEWQKGVASFFPKAISNNNNTSEENATRISTSTSSTSSSSSSFTEQPGVSSRELEIESLSEN